MSSEASGNRISAAAHIVSVAALVLGGMVMVTLFKERGEIPGVIRKRWQEVERVVKSELPDPQKEAAIRVILYEWRPR